MCDECLTDEVKVLVPSHEYMPGHYWHWTLRIDFSRVLIVGVQETIATFKFDEVSEGIVLAELQVKDPVEWVYFLPAYARAQGKEEKHYYEMVKQLKAEAVALYPRIKANLATLED